MKIFISQPMRGRSQEDILRDRAKIKEYAVKRFGNDVVFLDQHLDFSGTVSPLKALGEAIKVLADADLFILSPGSKESRGGQIELQCAVRYGIPLVTITDPVD